MKWREVQGGWAVVLGRGDDVLDCLRQVAREARIRSGAFSGLGAVDGVQLAFWDMDRKQYLRTDLAGDHEIGALVGNITTLDGEPFVHAHAVVGGRDFAARTGHLMTARCSATVEIFVHDFANDIRRGPDPVVGLNLWQL
jgi:predicted DNA-binding protein with PD1-like motif